MTEPVSIDPVRQAARFRQDIALIALMGGVALALILTLAFLFLSVEGTSVLYYLK